MWEGFLEEVQLERGLDPGEALPLPTHVTRAG